MLQNNPYLNATNIGDFKWETKFIHCRSLLQVRTSDSKASQKLCWPQSLTTNLMLFVKKTWKQITAKWWHWYNQMLVFQRLNVKKSLLINSFQEKIIWEWLGILKISWAIQQLWAILSEQLIFDQLLLLSEW